MTGLAMEQALAVGVGTGETTAAGLLPAPLHVAPPRGMLLVLTIVWLELTWLSAVGYVIWRTLA